MNERIADIMSEAFKLCKKYEDEGETGLVKTTEAFYIFAKLIVSECRGVVNDGSKLGGWYDMRIKEHFGVEE